MGSKTKIKTDESESNLESKSSKSSKPPPPNPKPTSSAKSLPSQNSSNMKQSSNIDAKQNPKSVKSSSSARSSMSIGFQDGGDSVEEGQEETGIPLINASEEDTPEQEKLYEEYLDIVKQIGIENDLITEKKQAYNELRKIKEKTTEDKNQMLHLRNEIKFECTRCQCMVSRAIYLQNFGSKRYYPPITLPTSMEEDVLRPLGPKINHQITRKVSGGKGLRFLSCHPQP